METYLMILVAIVATGGVILLLGGIGLLFWALWMRWYVEPGRQAAQFPAAPAWTVCFANGFRLLRPVGEARLLSSSGDLALAGDKGRAGVGSYPSRYLAPAAPGSPDPADARGPTGSCAGGSPAWTAP